MYFAKICNFSLIQKKIESKMFITSNLKNPIKSLIVNVLIYRLMFYYVPLLINEALKILHLEINNYYKLLSK